MSLYFSSHNEDYQITALRSNHSASTQVGPIADISEEKHHGESEECPNSGESIGGSAIEADRPDIKREYMKRETQG